MSSHSGHRQRLKNRFLAEGLDGFDPHVVLELLLFFGRPRVNTNEIAHALLRTFGSLNAVFDAPYEALIQVEGVGENCALLLKMVPEMSRRYLVGKTEERYLDTTEAMGAYLLPFFVGRLKETVYLLCLDNKMKPLGCSAVFEGNLNSVSLSMREIVQTALKFNAYSAVVAHNHPGGVALPSNDDLLTTGKIVSAFESVGIVLLDHIIVADEDFVSLKDSGFIQ